MAAQEFAHPQARFLHEKQHALSPRARHWLGGLLAAVNRASFKAIDGAMFVGTVRPVACHHFVKLHILHLGLNSGEAPISFGDCSHGWHC